MIEPGIKTVKLICSDWVEDFEVHVFFKKKILTCVLNSRRCFQHELIG